MSEVWLLVLTGVAAAGAADFLRLVAVAFPVPRAVWYVVAVLMAIAAVSFAPLAMTVWHVAVVGGLAQFGLVVMDWLRGRS